MKAFEIYFIIQYFLSALKHKIQLHDDQIYNSMIHFGKSPSSEILSNLFTYDLTKV